MSTRPSLARALYDAYRALPARERAAFDRLLGSEDGPLAPPRRTRVARTRGGAEVTRAALDELRGGGGHRVGTLSDLLGDA